MSGERSRPSDRCRSPRVSAPPQGSGWWAELTEFGTGNGRWRRGHSDTAFRVPQLGQYRGPGLPAPVLLARGRVQGCGAGPGREPVAVGEPGNVTDVGQRPGGEHGTDTAQVRQPRPAGLDQNLSSAVARLQLPSPATRPASSSAAIHRRVFPAMSRGRTDESSVLACLSRKGVPRATPATG